MPYARHENVTIVLASVAAAKAELRVTRQKAKAQQEESERRATRTAAELAKIRQERDDLQIESRAKRRSAEEAEERAQKLQNERDVLARERDTLKREFEADARQRDAEEQRLHGELDAVQADAKATVDAIVGERSVGESSQKERTVASCKRIEELEAEVTSLRLLLDQVSAEREVGAHLRQRHLDCEAELKSSRGLKEEVRELRATVFRLEQEETSLKAALYARGKALIAMEEESRGASLARRDLDAFVEVARSIVVDVAESGHQARATKDCPRAMDISVAWTRCQRDLGDLRHRRAELQAALDEVTAKGSQASAKVQQLNSELAAAQAQSETNRLDASRARDENSKLDERFKVVRSAIETYAKTGKVAAAVALSSAVDSTPTRVDLERHRSDAEALATARAKALELMTRELEECRKERDRLSNVDMRHAQLTRAHEELRRELATSRSAVSIATTDADVRALEVKAGAAPQDYNMENALAVRQLEEFKKATKKYVQEFREGIYLLLGWKVEMRHDCHSPTPALRYHLASLYSPGQERADGTEVNQDCFLYLLLRLWLMPPPRPTGWA